MTPPSVLEEISIIGGLVSEIVSLVHTLGNPAGRMRAIRDSLQAQAIAASDLAMRQALEEQAKAR